MRMGLFTVLAYLAGTLLASGQATTSLRGTVTDPQGKAVSNATATLFSQETSFERTTQTNGAGQYEFAEISPGKYVVRVVAQGFATYEQRGVQLLVKTPATVDMVLVLGVQSQKVEVTSQASALDLNDASLGTPFNENQIKQIPLDALNVPDLLSVQAGVVYTSSRPDINLGRDTRSGAVDGARSDQSNITLDGVDVNDQSKGYAFTSVLPVTLDSVQEFRVTTTNYGADQGRSSGAQMALVTKSGTNQLHGSLYEYNRNTATSANDYFVKLAELNDGEPNEPPKLIRNIFGASLGGPFIKNRFFFFLNYEGARQREEDSTVRTIPSATLRAGFIQYPNVNGGTTVLNPEQITALDPLHRGPDPVVESYFNTYPLPNDNSVGDGLNFSGYRFRGPVSIDKDYYIARADYRLDANGNHTLFWRGALQNINDAGVPFLPGTKPEQTTLDFSKGFALGYTGLFGPTLVNNFRWGLTRQSTAILGDSTQPWNELLGMDQGITRSYGLVLPVHNLVDDLTKSRGRHTWQFGTNVAIAREPERSLVNSFSYGQADATSNNTGGFANTGSPLNPIVGGYPAVNPTFNNSYDLPMGDLLGMVDEVYAVYNYSKSGSLLPQGTPISRRFGADWWELYGQDTFHVKPNLTLTYGLRYSLYSPPWETNGYQAQPTISLGALVKQRQKQMALGIPSNTDPMISYNLSGPANGGPPFYNWDRTDFAPRASVAYSPAPGGWLKKFTGDKDQTVIRGGFSVVYDDLGLALINTFDQNTSTGFSTVLNNPPGTPTVYDSPRLTSLNVIPTMNLSGQPIFLPPPPGQFPQTPPASLAGGGFQIAWGMDNTMKTPRSLAYNISIGRQLPKNFSLDIAYVGRFSQRLLAQEDLMMPLDLKDVKSGIDYFAAAQRMSQLYRANTPISNVNSATIGKTGTYWEHMIQGLQKGGAYSYYCGNGSTTDIVQEIYEIYTCFPYNDTTAIYVFDALGIPDANNPNVTYFSSGGAYSFFSPQYASLYAWQTNTNASYNALQINLRRHFGSNLELDFNYTFSKSIDVASDAARVSPGLTEGSSEGLGDQVANTWAPNQLRGVSDFDTPNQISADWIAQIPFGKGKRWLSSSSPTLNAFLGHWQLSGLGRWSSGFPVSVDNGFVFPTNWSVEGNADTLQRPSTGVTKFGDGTVSMFTDGAAAIADFGHPYPGGSGARNTFRGDGVADLDLSLAKRWLMPWNEKQSVQFRWEVFNALNLTRFDVQSNRPTLEEAAGFGNYTGLLSSPREMQFAVRYEF